MKKLLITKRQSVSILIIFFVASLLIYYSTSSGNTVYNHFTLLADALLHGKIYITADAPWLEKIPINQHDFYVANPPMPALLSIPFVAIFGKNFPQQYIAHLVGASLIILTMLISYNIKKDKKLAMWSGLLIGFGTIIWFMSATGSVWYLGQTTATFFLLAAVLETLTKKRPLITGFLIGAAYLSRIHLLLSIPFFLYALNINHQKLKKIFLFGLGLMPFLLFNALYNYLRFGVIWDKGYLLIPGLLSEPWISKGIINLAYIPNHLQLLFLQLPKFITTFPYIEPNWVGLAIWITTPAFIFSLQANLKDHLNKLAWLTIFALLFVVSIRGGTGWTQFGYRYAVDFYPFLLYLTIKSIATSHLKWYHWLLLFLSILVNLWGVLWINKFGWVSF